MNSDMSSDTNIKTPLTSSTSLASTIGQPAEVKEIQTGQAAAGYRASTEVPVPKETAAKAADVGSPMMQGPVSDIEAKKAEATPLPGSHTPTLEAGLSRRPSITAENADKVAQPKLQQTKTTAGSTATSDSTGVEEAKGESKVKISGSGNTLSIIKSMHACLTRLDHVDIKSVDSFAANLFEACQAKRAGLDGEKKADQTFCREVVHGIIEHTKTETANILKDSNLTGPEKEQKMTKLAFMSQSLIALTGVQERFGGRLGFHCMQHSLGVATGSAAYFKGTDKEFAAFCAGANHDAVMDYQAAPAVTDPNNKGGQEKRTNFQNALDTEMQKRTTLDETKGTQVGEAKQSEAAGGKGLLEEFLDTKYGVLKDLKNNSEQRRNAGWQQGNSEKESFEQMKVQLKELVGIMKESQKGDQINSDLMGGVEKSVGKDEAFQETLIRGTIPTKANFNPPGFGDKLFTIGNVNIFPGPAQLASLPPAMQKRMADVMDNVIKEVMGNKSDVATFGQALADMNDTKDYYTKKVTVANTDGSTTQVDYYTTMNQKVDALAKARSEEMTMADPSAKPDMSKLAAGVRDELRQKGEIPRYTLPSFLEGMKGFFLSEMPPFTDPVKQLTKAGIGQDEMMKALTKQLMADTKNGPELLDYMLQQVSNIGTGVADLGALMMEGCEKDWACEESVALIVEENPYQASMFFEVNKKLMDSGFNEGLATASVHDGLSGKKEDAFGKDLLGRCGITPEEYGGMKEFMHLTNYFAKEQKPFADGRIQLVQHYIYEPMKALQDVLSTIGSDPNLGILAQKYNADVNQCVGNFEGMFTDGVDDKGLPKLRDSSLKGVEDFIAENKKSPSTLCGTIIKQMEKRWGAGFVKDPGKYGYTSNGDAKAGVNAGVDKGYLAEQKDLLRIMR